MPNKHKIKAITVRPKGDLKERVQAEAAKNGNSLDVEFQLLAEDGLKARKEQGK